MPIETQKLEALVQVFEDFGYPPEYRRDRYPVWTGREVSTVALAGFGTSTGFDMTTSTMVGLIANGHASADGLDAARALAAPLALVARDDEIELWAVATAPENTAIIATTAYHELPDFAGRYSVSLGRTTLWNAKQTGHQLALFPLDVRLLSHARGKTTESLAGLVEAAMQIGMEDAPAHDTERSKERLVHVSRLVVGVMAALMIRDKSGESSTDASQLLELAAKMHPRYFTWIGALPKVLREHLSEIVSLLGTGVNFASLDAAVVSRVYEDAVTTPSIRRRFGIYYTPPPLADRILDAIPLESILPDQRTIHDPACGSGTLLLAAHQRLAALHSQSATEPTRHYLRRMLSGADQDPLAVDLARLSLLLTAAGDGWNVDQRTLDPANPLRGERRPMVIVSNPPWADIRRASKQREQLADMFVRWILDSVNPSGFIALVLPSSWLTTRASASVRADLMGRASVFEVWRLTEEVFAGSDQAPCVVVAQMGANRRHFAFRRVLPRRGALERFFQTGIADEYLLAETGEGGDTLLRGPVDELERTASPRLGDVAAIRSGIVPEPGRKMQRTDGNAWWLERAGDLVAYAEVPQSALVRAMYPDDFHRAGRTPQRAYLEPKLLVSAKRTTENPWRLKVAIDSRGVIPRESVHMVLPKNGIDIFGLLALLASTVASCYVDTHGTKVAYGVDLLRRIPMPPEGKAWIELAKSGRRLVKASAHPGRLATALSDNEVIVRDAYGLSKDTCDRLDRHFGGFNAPEGRVRYPHPTDQEIVSGTGTRLFGAVLGVERGYVRLWIPGVTPEDGEETSLPARLPGWLCETGATFELLRKDADLVSEAQYVFQAHSYVDPPSDAAPDRDESGGRLSQN